MTTREFGGRHTELKLRVVMEYLEAYLKVMKNKPFRLTYIDAFAGSGWRRAAVRSDERQTTFLPRAEATKGSALMVFELRYEGRRFDRFVFGDRDEAALKRLRADVEAAYPDLARRPDVAYRPMDANELIAAECDSFRDTDRAVMFLDPYGMQVDWRSIERIAASRVIDLWYLAPTGIAFNRLLSPAGRVRNQWIAPLERSLGPNWDAEFYESTRDLLGEQGRRREQGYEAVIRSFERKWRALFGEGAPSSGGLRLKAGNSLPYLLCFACTNPSPKARGPALRIAEALMKKARHGELF
jgi:three-Cys-motif partner protein